MKGFSGAVTIALWICFSGAQAQSAAVSKSTDPQLKLKQVPQLSQYIKHRRQDTLVMLSLDIDANGRVERAEVIEGFFDESQVDGAIRLAKSLRFDPATRDGVPVATEGYAVNFRLRSGGDQRLTPSYKAALAEAVRLIESKDWDGAMRQADHMLADEVGNMYGFAVMQLALAQAYEGGGERFDALRTLRRATMYERSGPVDGAPPSSVRAYSLPEPVLSSALRRRMLLEVGLGYYADAIETFKQLAALGPVPDEDPVVRVKREVEAALVSKADLDASGRIDRQSKWAFNANRSRFAVQSTEAGKLDAIELRCKQGHRSLQVHPEVEWTVPAGWETCRLEFHGTVGTRFRVRFFNDSPVG